MILETEVAVLSRQRRKVRDRKGRGKKKNRKRGKKRKEDRESKRRNRLAEREVRSKHFYYFLQQISDIFENFRFFWNFIDFFGLLEPVIPILENNVKL